MAYAIIRIAKLTSRVHAHNATTHNYRKHEVTNADSNAQFPNREYINKSETDYWTLAETRIAQAVTRKVREDQVRAVEVVLTGSPEAFVRDKDGRAADYSKSKWAQDNLNFLKDKFGEKNLISFTLHQDEKTPHIHAVIVPITKDGRLSAKDIFTRSTLRQLQTDYAVAMTPHGMTRGIEHSQAEHQPMRRQYGQEQQIARKVAELTQPLDIDVPQPFKIGTMPGLLNRDEWKREQENCINAEIARQVLEAQLHEREKSKKLAELAQANTSAAEQVKTLRKQLSTSERLKQEYSDKLDSTTSQVEELKKQSSMVAVQLAQGGGHKVTELELYGQQVRESARKILLKHLEQILASPIQNVQAFTARLKESGYSLGKDPNGKSFLLDESIGAKFAPNEIKPNDKDLPQQLAFAIERTALEIAESAKRQQKRGQKHGGISL